MSAQPVVSVRFKPADLEAVQEAADAAGVKPSEYLRRAALGAVQRDRIVERLRRSGEITLWTSPPQATTTAASFRYVYPAA